MNRPVSGLVKSQALEEQCRWRLQLSYIRRGGTETDVLKLRACRLEFHYVAEDGGSMLKSPIQRLI